MSLSCLTESLELKVTDLLRKCNFKQLRQIQAVIITSSLILHTQIASAFLRRSTEFGEMEYADIVFDQMGSVENKNVTIWNAVIRGYAFNGPFEKCLQLFDEMTQRGLQPNNFTYPFVINVLSQTGMCDEAQKVHCRVVKSGFGSNHAVLSSLFDMYLKVEHGLSDARKVFDEMRVKPIELWNRMMDAYGKNAQVENSKLLFESMPEKDVVSWNTLISAYAAVKDADSARRLFDRMPEKNVVSWTSMIGVYAALGDSDTARSFFEQMPVRNIVSWNSLLSCYTRLQKFEQALDLFAEMARDGIPPDGFTFVSVLTASAHLGNLQVGKWIHCLLGNVLQLGVELQTALMEMYAKCGDSNKAFTIFIKVGNKDVFCWNVMIKSLAIHGRASDSIKLFNSMRDEGLKPNSFTLSSVLFACSHGGYVTLGRKIFCAMESEFSIIPKLEHYGCFVDLLCRNGLVEEALDAVKSMPLEADVAIWGALLGGCKARNDLNLAENVLLECVDSVEGSKSGLFVLLSNMHAAADHWSEALLARRNMDNRRNVVKETGISALI